MGELVKVATKDEIKKGEGLKVTAADHEIALFNIDGSIYAIGNTCTHAEGPLAEGDVEGCEVTCPWHGATFNIKTGEALSAPAADSVPTYKVVIEGDDVKVELPD